MDKASTTTNEADPTDEPAFKRFKYLSNIESEKLKQSSSQPQSPLLNPGQDEIDMYLYDEARPREDSEPLDYWRDNELKYPLLSALAFDLLVIPASSAPIERVFSTAGQPSLGKRDRLTYANLEREVLVKRNTSYL